jgi:uncharacterized protein (DUF2164 family)
VATVLDDSPRYSIVIPLIRKSEVAEVVIKTFTMLERSLERRIKAVRTNNGSEYVNSTLTEYFAAQGITHQTRSVHARAERGSRATQPHTA